MSELRKTMLLVLLGFAVCICAWRCGTDGTGDNGLADAGAYIDISPRELPGQVDRVAPPEDSASADSGADYAAPPPDAIAPEIHDTSDLQEPDWTPETAIDPAQEVLAETTSELVFELLDDVGEETVDEVVEEIAAEVVEEVVEEGGCAPAAVACPQAPLQCNEGGGNDHPIAGKLKETSADGFQLVDEDGWQTKAGLIDQIEQHWSTSPTTLADLFADLNRDADKIIFKADVECFHTGFSWNSGDANVDYWVPQGITGTASAYPSGSYAGKKVALVAWYHKTEEDPGAPMDKGVRVSFVDTTGMSNLKYRHALLVEPVNNGGTPDFNPVPVHAGGIAWYKNYLYVADTSKGLRVFDLSRILQVQTENKDWIGLVSEGKGYHAFKYKYVVPQVNRYSLCPESCCARFSFVSLDLSTNPPTLVAGEYSKDVIAGRLHRWLVDPDTGRLVTVGGAADSLQAFFPGVLKMQGALSWDGQYFISSSRPKLSWLPSPGTLFIGTPGSTLQERSWPYPPQDLHYSMFSDNLWCQTEHPPNRYVFAVKMADIVEGCF